MQKRKMSYTKLGIMSGVVFLILVVFIEFLFALNAKETVAEITNNILTPKYIISKLVVGVFYGVLMVFLFKRKEKKILKK